MPLLPNGEYLDVFESTPRRTLYTANEIQLHGVNTFGWQCAKHFDEQIPWHFHRDCFEFHYLIHGSVTFVVDDKEYLMKDGDVFVTLPNELHRSGENIIFRKLYWFSISDRVPLLNLEPASASYLMEGLHNLKNRVISVGNEMKELLKCVFHNITSQDKGQQLYASMQMACFLYKLIEYDRTQNACTYPDNGFRTGEAIPVQAGDVMHFGAAVTTQGWHLVTLDEKGQINGAMRLSSGISIAEGLDNDTSIMKYTVKEGCAYLRFIADTRYVDHYLVTRNQPFDKNEYHRYFTEPSSCALNNLFDPMTCQVGWLYWKENDERILSQQIAYALEFIEQNKKRTIPLEEVAQHCNLSLSLFKRRFKKEIGSTPALYIEKQRIACAKEMLRAGHSITETAYELDFCSSNYFSTVFRRITLMTPSQYIQKTRVAK